MIIREQFAKRFPFSPHESINPYGAKTVKMTVETQLQLQTYPEMVNRFLPELAKVKNPVFYPPV